jgi:hypothetical protein
MRPAPAEGAPAEDATLIARASLLRTLLEVRYSTRASLLGMEDRPAATTFSSRAHTRA